MAKMRNLIICGVGVKDQSIIDSISKADQVIVRGGIATRWLATNNINNVKLFKVDADINIPLEQVINQWIVELKDDLGDDATIAYVSPVTPILSDRVAAGLIDIVEKSSVQIHSGIDLSIHLIQQSPLVFLSPVVTIDGLSLRGLHHPPFSPANSVMIYFPGDLGENVGVYKLLKVIYPAEHAVSVLFEMANGNTDWNQVPLEKLVERNTPIAALYIPPFSLDSSLENFQEVIAHLRAPNGCPWDKKQTHSSLRTYLLEETYEALDALDKNDFAGLREELGDLLLQILLHAQIAQESHEFTLGDVLSGINRKIVYRHPHVFKDWIVDDEQDVVQNWESLKELERLKNGDEEKKGMLDGVPISFPALAQAQAIQDRAARVGFDWPEITPVINKVLEELEEVKTAINEAERAKELGDLLFAIVNLIRWYKVDAESALRKTNVKFRKRFAYIEENARKTGKDLLQMSLEEMDSFWEQAKEYDD
ncbi:MAG: hypothetical protein FD147_1617 [Chloroflexi bacterium]|nr:MAG: hypothetical protein FD147_1617 [Chloroflexota bacterium]